MGLDRGTIAWYKESSKPNETQLISLRFLAVWGSPPPLRHKSAQNGQARISGLLNPLIHLHISSDEVTRGYAWTAKDTRRAWASAWAHSCPGWTVAAINKLTAKQLTTLPVGLNGDRGNLYPDRAASPGSFTGQMAKLDRTLLSIFSPIDVPTVWCRRLSKAVGTTWHRS
jgi:hypothetical protein